MASPRLLAHVFRRDLVESEHFGHIVVADRTGAIRYEIGDANTRVFLRSAAKPVQAIPAIVSGVPTAFNLTAEEMALACASHNGEAFHVEAAASLLKKIGLDAQNLQCGVHRPLGVDLGCVAETGDYSVLQNNCSGKHALMLAACVHADLPSDNYLAPEHPHQLNILNSLAEYGKLSPHAIGVGVDGCSAPVFNLPLLNLATVYARLADRNLPGHTCFNYMASEPQMVAGTNRFDTTFMAAMNGKAIAKIGAEGLQCVALTEPEPLGIAVKISDGSNRAAPAVMLAILHKMGSLPEAVMQQLTPYFEPELRNHRGMLIGKIEPVQFE